MKFRAFNFAALVILAVFMGIAAAMAGTGPKAASKKPAVAASDAAAHDSTSSLEGERKFHENCSRCHTYPSKFPPRMMSTIVRHMRVRANITDEEMRQILRYMTE